MENDFETLISSYIENSVGISENFLSKNLSAQLKLNLLALYDQKLLLAAGIGNAEKLNHNTGIRSDVIYWLDREHNDKHENDFFNRVEDFIAYLNKTCYAGITGYEFHYSLYEAGSFYKKHTDQFQNNSGRQFSMISYLNNNWQENDGGHLLIHHDQNDEMIAPTNGKTIFFKSDELAHEVLITTQQRMSITGWLKKD